MKVKVLKTFKDKETGSVLKPNLIIDIMEERIEELLSYSPGPLIEVIEEEVKVEVEEVKAEEAKKDTKKKSTKK